MDSLENISSVMQLSLTAFWFSLNGNILFFSYFLYLDFFWRLAIVLNIKKEYKYASIFMKNSIISI